jgi:uncharacterized protein (TIGR02569 family)
LKPTTDAHEAEWIGNVLTDIVEDGFRVARPIRSVGGSWAFAGWTAWERVGGTPTKDRWEVVFAAGRSFHHALRDVAKPDFLHDRTHPWAVGDRVAFGEETVPILEPIAGQVARLRAHLDDPEASEQVIHADLTQNVLVHGDGLPAIIDFSPYYRPIGYAAAIVVVDAIVWYGAPLSLAAKIEPAEARNELLARALIFRLVASALQLATDEAGLRHEAHAHKHLVEHVIQQLT